MERVGPDLLALIQQYLSLCEKQAAVTRLSRAFHPLRASAFLHTSLLVLGPCVTARGQGFSERDE